MFTCKPYEVDSDMPIFPPTEDEPVGLEHFLVEPECKEDWVSGLLDLDALQIEKCFNIEDIASTFDYDHINLDTDEVHPHLTKEEGNSPEISSETSQEINIGCRGENQSDAKHTNQGSSLIYGLYKESRFGTTGTDNQSHSHDIHKREFGNELVKSSSTHLPVFKNTNNHHYFLHDLDAAKDSHGTFKSMSGLETLGIDDNWPKKNDFYGFQNYTEFDNCLNPIKYEAISDENEEDKAAFSSIDGYCGSASGSATGALKHQSMSRDQHMKRKRVDGCESLMTSTSNLSKVELSCLDEEDKVGQLVSPKRSRKPPRRYIEESLEYEFKPFHKKCGIGKKSKDKLLHDRYPKHKWQKEFHGEQVAYEDDSFNGGCIQVPFGLPMDKEHPKKNKPSPVRNSEDPKDNRLLSSHEKLDIVPLFVESQEDISEDECVARSSTPKGSGRRKRHISWTPEEVVKLVDGVSQCGVGRWTEIKRLLFSSSSHRTSVDLKDKWRNLLRASCTQSQIKEKVEQGRKQSSNYVSESILWRVRELSVIYPYPRESRESRESRSKVSCTGPAASSFPTGSSNTLVPLSTVV